MISSEECCFIKPTNSSYLPIEILEDYYKPHSRRMPKLLELDSHTAHLKKESLIYTKKLNFPLVIIVPGGCTNHLKPLDSIVMRNFKGKQRI